MNDRNEMHVQVRVLWAFSFFPIALLAAVRQTWYVYLIVGVAGAVTTVAYLLKNAAIKKFVAYAVGVSVFSYYFCGVLLIHEFSYTIWSFIALYICVGLVGGYWYLVFVLSKVINSERGPDRAK